MNLNTLTDAIADEVLDDSTLDTWATTTFSASVTVYQWVDNENPPGPEACPYVALQPTGAVYADSLDSDLPLKPHYVLLQLAIKDESAATEADHKVELPGGENLVVFVNHVKRILSDRTFLAGIGSGIKMVDFEVEIDPLEHYPMYLATIRGSFYEVMTVGSNPHA